MTSASEGSRASGEGASALSRWKVAAVPTTSMRTTTSTTLTTEEAEPSPEASSGHRRDVASRAAVDGHPWG